MGRMIKAKEKLLHEMFFKLFRVIPNEAQEETAVQPGASFQKTRTALARARDTALFSGYYACPGYKLQTRP
jgi:hypothetical protein